MSTQFSGFESYRKLSHDLRDKIQKLKLFSDDLKMDSLSKSLDEVLQKTATDGFKVAVVGEFKRGKSTLINALLGKKILPADVMPTTAAINMVTYGPKPGVLLIYKDGTKEEVGIDSLSDYVTKLTDEAEERAAKLRTAIITYPTDYCRNNVDIIDTPGLNDDSTMTEVTLSVLPEIDAALFVIMASSPFSEYERDFLCNKILTSDLGRVIFVVTGIDRLDEEDVDRVLDNIRSRIKKYVLEKAKKVMGEDSPEYENYRRKIGDPRVFGISAKQALKAKKNNDSELLTQSCFPVFEQNLEQFLTEDRGIIALEVCVNKLIAAADEITQTIKLRINALEMSFEEFQKKHSQAQQCIADIRKKRQIELDRIKTSSAETFVALRPVVAHFWDEVITDVTTIISNTQITGDMISKEHINATTEELIHKIHTAVENKSRMLAEQVDLQINKSIGEEVKRLDGFGQEFQSSVESILSGFTPQEESQSADWMILAGATAVGTFIGGGIVTGAVLGYKEGGWKGMLAGSGIGAATAITTATGVFALIGTATVAWPVFVGICAVSALTGGLASKWAVQKIFGNKKIEEFKRSLTEKLIAEYQNARNSNDLEQRVKEQVNIVFDSLAEKVHSETESILSNLERTLADISQQTTEHRVLAEHEKTEFRNKMDELKTITAFSLELNKSLLAAMAK